MSYIGIFQKPDGQEMVAIMVIYFVPVPNFVPG